MSCKSVVSGVIAAVFVLVLSATVAAAGTVSKNPARASSSSPAAAAARAVTPTAFETATLNRINTYRVHRGLRALGVHEKLYLLSQQHSRHMAATHRLSHDGFYNRYLLSGFGFCILHGERRVELSDSRHAGRSMEVVAGPQRKLAQQSDPVRWHDPGRSLRDVLRMRMSRAARSVE